MSWRKVKLGDLGRIVTGKTPPRGRAEYFGDEFPFVTPSDFGFMHYQCNQVAEGVSLLGFEKHKNQTIPAGTPMCVCIGNTIGKCAISSAPSLTNQQINSIVANESSNPCFIYYLLCNVREQIRAVGLGGGAAQPIINKSKFSALEVMVPDLKAQEAIAETLSTYDDLIENNRRRIALLEEAARLLYREWFVHFRFPGHEHVQITDGLPEGWENTGIKQAYVGLFDGPHATPAPSDEGPIFLGIKNIRETGGLDLSNIRHVSETDYPKWTRRVTPAEGDIVFSYEATLNRYALIPRGFKCCLGRRMALIRPKDEYRYYLFLHMFSENWRKVIAGRVINGATVDRIPLKTFPDFPIAIPPRKVAVSFNEAVEPQFKMMELLNEQNQKLTQARDLLLPRLMSGEIAV